MLSTPVFGDSSNAQPRAKSTPGIAIGIKINDHARLRSGISVRSISQANITAMPSVSNVPMAEMTIVVPRAW